MIKQLDPGRCSPASRTSPNAGEQVVETISPRSWAASSRWPSRQKDKEVERLTIGPPDFDASFSTVPDFDIIHERVDQLLASASEAQSAGSPDDTLVVPAPATGRLQAAPAPAAQPAAGGTRTQQSPPPSDFTPVTTTPDGEPSTEAMLNELKRQGDEQAHP
jgi:hypothetical protein